ncbi:MAG TPA: hypothetical protein VK481_00415 [Gemmatimonadaceae bacterium]|nr:hypothetical protein [Gemmatimonadaceae bacterium]
MKRWFRKVSGGAETVVGSGAGVRAVVTRPDVPQVPRDLAELLEADRVDWQQLFDEQRRERGDVA